MDFGQLCSTVTFILSGGRVAPSRLRHSNHGLIAWCPGRTVGEPAPTCPHSFHEGHLRPGCVKRSPSFPR
ncbi:hypothetical protein MXAN_5240 [Myxococcus xanthus DK 1622]|uniref:Uncharacterized protein n=1 Tax=Myxococcus xanthus (strain DK1622) TaxID=246197 RepID=Q1D1T1_MYXXD|nr:hypothetical protein MXAN_5240 [Myxococcus xanthus DK 1622]